jgi:ribulose 1,5-bisphosphate synthetase/thiazole synthase
MSNEVNSLDVIIIGGELAGLTTAALLARSGKAVTLFEHSSREIGGRARTVEIDGFYFNQGPHALFLTDASDSILKEIGTEQEWLDKNIQDLNDSEIIKTILRLNTYANDPGIQSIGPVLHQIYVGSQAGVKYLDGGWQTLVDGQ